MNPTATSQLTRKCAVAAKLSLTHMLLGASALLTYSAVTLAGNAPPQPAWLEVSLNATSVGTELSYCDAQR